ncbi:MAG: ornithine cyclodeaminase family protein [Dehalococcoidia bacterium]|nr:ornithine cyclodeaminase family protein [Dehalococcoidia bacterium]
MTLYLTEADVDRLLDMDAALYAVESSLLHQAGGNAINQPRQRLNAGPDTHVNTMMASDGEWGVFGFKTYTFAGGVYNFFVFLSDSRTGALLAIIEANRMGQLRTGAATGVATRLMAVPEASSVGVIGSGFQARTQLEAVSKVRELRRVKVYSPNRERRRAYALEMSEKLELDIAPVPSARDAISGTDIAITITSSRTPVLYGEWLEPGMCIAAVGGADPYVRELDSAAVSRADIVVVDDRSQSRIESGELMIPASRGLFIWERTRELWQVVSGQASGRESPDDVTLFKSLGMALWDVTSAKVVYDRAVEQGIGRSIP